MTESPLPRAFSELSRLGTEQRITPDTLLWREGEPGHEVVLLVEGVLEVTHESPDGDEVVLRTLQPGAVAGEIGSFEGQTRSATVKAATHCRVLRVPAPAFRALVAQRPDVLEELFWQQVGHVRSLTREVVRRHRRSILDRLTRAYTGAFFRDRLRGEVERAREAEDAVSVALFDVDQLSDYNERHGKDGGDAALAAIVEVLRTTGRRGDVIGRLAGEEFAILLYGATRPDALRFAEKVRARVAETALPGRDAPGALTVTGGVSTCPDDGTNAEGLLEAARADLDLAKQAGGNRVGRP